MSDCVNESPSRSRDAVLSMTERISSWIIPALVGAILTLLFSISGDRAVVELTAVRVDKVETRVKDIERELAGGGPPALARRVDDLQTQTQEQYKDLSKKLDNIQELLLKRK